MLASGLTQYATFCDNHRAKETLKKDLNLCVEDPGQHSGPFYVHLLLHREITPVSIDKANELLWDEFYWEKLHTTLLHHPLSRKGF